MKRRLPAFATLAAVGLLALTAAFLAGAVLSSRQLLVDRSRAETLLDTRSAAWETVGKLNTALQETWNADAQTLDAWWINHAPSFPTGSALLSLSSRINLNSITPFLLQDSELIGTLLGKSVEDFTTYRANNGPFVALDEYKDYFQPEALNTLYCAHSFFNANTADEIMLEKILTLRTGDATFASTVRASVREFRTNRRIMAQSDLDALIGGEKEAVGDLLTINPELDVNTVSPAVLLAILRDPDWKLDQPDAKLQVLMAGRASKPWAPETLQQALGVDTNSPLLQYLGTRCRFLQGSVPAGSAVLTFIMTVDYSTDSPPKLTLRILQTYWTTA
jgi:hypothetical protein